jgi:hypothetical protein
MRRFHLAHVLLALAIVTSVLLGASAVIAADLAIPPRKAQPERAPREISVQQGPANCSRWTDECVSCMRGAAGEAPVCSNIGFACQPKAIRCLSPTPRGESQTK